MPSSSSSCKENKPLLPYDSRRTTCSPVFSVDSQMNKPVIKHQRRNAVWKLETVSSSPSLSVGKLEENDDDADDDSDVVEFYENNTRYMRVNGVVFEIVTPPNCTGSESVPPKLIDNDDPENTEPSSTTTSAAQAILHGRSGSDGSGVGPGVNLTGLSGLGGMTIGGLTMNRNMMNGTPTSGSGAEVHDPSSPYYCLSGFGEHRPSLPSLLNKKQDIDTPENQKFHAKLDGGYEDQVSYKI